MKKFIIDTATQTTLNIIVVDPDNLPVLPEGQEFRDEGGLKGQYWNGSAWVFPDERLAEIERARRNNKLALHVDGLAGNALRWAALTAEQQQAWADYRQALLDVPQQEGFPHNVAWPTKPQ
jgi:hypothetical protein